MTDQPTLRDATVTDLSAINDIYNHYVANCTCSAEDQPSSLARRRESFGSHGSKYPVLVAVVGGQVAGWGAISPFHRRSGYRFTVEDSIYIRPDSQGRGLGKLDPRRAPAARGGPGYHSVMALISADQKPSLILHEKFGFVRCAYLPQVGFKFGHWLDVVYMEKLLTT